MKKRTYSKHHKRRGELAEAEFLARALSLGLRVSKPWGDSDHYDFIVDNLRKLYRIQVRSVTALINTGYMVSTTSTQVDHKPYTSEHIDFIAAYVVPMRVWYVIPVIAIGAATAVRLFPHDSDSRGRFEPFREAWHLLTQPIESAAAAVPA